MREKVLHFLATGFYSGLSPVAPGTIGSIAYIIIWYLFLADNYYLQILAASFCALGGYYVVKAYLPLVDQSNSKKKDDPAFIVIDEWAGLAIALLAASKNSPIEILLAFFLFRLFDIWKPWLVKKAEQKPGAIGVMLDDIVAGIFAFIIITLSCKI